eukprot:scaffold66001_cov30-Phaeocystis_antarctica.AAC.2
MATHVFTITKDDRHHPAASTLWFQGPGPGVRSLLSGAFTGGAANAAAVRATTGTGAMAASATISVTTCACHLNLSRCEK